MLGGGPVDELVDVIAGERVVLDGVTPVDGDQDRAVVTASWAIC